MYDSAETVIAKKESATGEPEDFAQLFSTFSLMPDSVKASKDRICACARPKLELQQDSLLLTVRFPR